MHKNIDIFSKLGTHREWAPAILRVVLGTLFITHGAGKLWGSPGLAGFNGMITGALGLPGIFTYLVAFGEFIGGIMLIAGFLTRYWTIYLGIIMTTAILAVKLKNGILAPELDYAFLAVLVSLFFTGAGKMSVDAWCEKRRGTKKMMTAS